MNLIKKLIVILAMAVSANVFARGGDDVGNGGFAYKQSVIILKMATSELERKIPNSKMDELVRNPKWREILKETLGYNDLDKYSKRNQSRGGQLLQLNYVVKPASVIVLEPFFKAFAGVTDVRLEEASLHVQKLLVHEAAHIWGFKEDKAEEFAIAFLKSANGEDTRPQVSIKDVCSCMGGKSDIISRCDNFCASKPITDQPILYVDFNPIVGNPLIKNIHDWCNMQLSTDQTVPGCMINANDGVTKYNLPVTTMPGSNQLTSNIQVLAKDRTWLLKVVESRTGSNAESTSYQIVRRLPDLPDGSVGLLKISELNQYTCFNFGIDYSHDTGARNSFARKFYHFTSMEIPSPMPPLTHGSPATTVCHDEILNPGNDSFLYERLELSVGVLGIWDKTDPRFVGKAEHGGKLTINKIIEIRLENEYNTHAAIDLFRPFTTMTSPTSRFGTFLGFVMTPFRQATTGTAYCPTSTDYNGTEPLFKILGDYMNDTEGLYLAEKEGEVITQGNESQTIYGTMFVAQSTLMNYGFFVEKGLKYKVGNETLHTKAIHFYWPFSTKIDRFTKGSRKLFTIKTFSTLNGKSIITQSAIEATTDKRIGCIPKIGN